MNDYQQTYDRFWKKIVEDEDGTLNVDQVKRELYDFHVMMKNVSEVYCHITGDRMSNPNYEASAVIAVYEDEVQRLVLEGRRELMAELEDSGMLLPSP